MGSAAQAASASVSLPPFCTGADQLVQVLVRLRSLCTDCKRLCVYAPTLLQVLVIPTDEELSIAQQTVEVIRQSQGVAAAA